MIERLEKFSNNVRIYVEIIIDSTRNVIFTLSPVPLTSSIRLCNSSVRVLAFPSEIKIASLILFCVITVINVNPESYEMIGISRRIAISQTSTTPSCSAMKNIVGRFVLHSAHVIIDSRRRQNIGSVIMLLFQIAKMCQPMERKAT